MILQSLASLYERLAEDPQNGLPRKGYSLQNITFRIVLREDGSVVEFQDARTTSPVVDKKGKERKTTVPLELLVPGQTKSAGQGINPCTLWDNLTYLAGYPQPDTDPKKAEKNRIRAPRCFAGSKELHIRLFSHDDESRARSAVSKFFLRYTPEKLTSFVDSLPEDARKGNGVFQLAGETKYAHHGFKPAAEEAEKKPLVSESQCLITGKQLPIARLHEPKIKTFDPKGSLLVSFNEAAYESYGKSGKESGQGRNSPISESAAFAYCNALNWLLARKERRFRISDATTVFWTAEPTPAESLFPLLMSGMPDAEDTGTRQRIAQILGKISRGTLGNDDLGNPKVPYFILGLSPNASRLSVRFWHTGQLGELIGNLKQHLNQLELVRQWDETNSKNPDPVHPSSYQILRQTAREADGIPPLLGGGLMRSILLGADYPVPLVTAVLNRIRAERDVGYLKASILKAWLVRNQRRWLLNNNIRMTTALDKNNPSVAYQLGRLFATYEQAQRAAHDFKLERTIRETMFSSASANPLSVFGRLDRLNKHHLQKLTGGSNRFFSDLIDEIHQKVKAPGFYPASLDLKNQSLFCIGYYHQRHEFRPNKTPEPESSNESVAA